MLYKYVLNEKFVGVNLLLFLDNGVCLDEKVVFYRNLVNFGFLN